MPIRIKLPQHGTLARFIFELLFVVLCMCLCVCVSSFVCFLNFVFVCEYVSACLFDCLFVCVRLFVYISEIVVGLFFSGLKTDFVDQMFQPEVKNLAQRWEWKAKCPHYDKNYIKEMKYFRLSGDVENCKVGPPNMDRFAVAFWAAAPIGDEVL